MDWRNYVKMSRWIGEHIPDSIGVGVRKSGTSGVYGNRKFFGITRVATISKDEVTDYKPGKDSTLLWIDISKATIPAFAPMLQYVFSGNIPINGKTSSTSALYAFPNSGLPGITQLLSYYTIEHAIWTDENKEHITKQDANITIYSPDKLLNDLRESNVRYLMLPSIRLNPAVSTGDVIGTMSRYLSMIRIKYPNIATLKHEIGKSEPATLWELHY
jgi:hypothetical protein